MLELVVLLVLLMVEFYGFGENVSDLEIVGSEIQRTLGSGNDLIMRVCIVSSLREIFKMLI